MSEQVTISRRFRGPPESGHGGYVCGLVAGFISGAAEVTLRRPPPLDRPLEVQRLERSGVVLRDGETVIAEGAPATVEMEIPQPVSFSEAEVASHSYFGFERPFSPTCFGCGPQRVEGDGLRIFAGWVRRRDVVAAPWTPDASLADANGTVRPEFVWAALDCPGAWTPFAVPTDVRPSLLGRLAAELLGPIQAGDRCVVIAWPLGREGRKLYSGTALFSDEGELRAVASATWIRPA